MDFCEPDTSWKFDPYELEKYDFSIINIFTCQCRLWIIYRSLHYHAALFSLQEEQARRSPREDRTDDGSFFIPHIHRHRHEFTRAASREPETSTGAATGDEEKPRFSLVFLQEFNQPNNLP